MQTFNRIAYLLKPAKLIIIYVVRPRRQVLQSAFILNIGEKQSNQVYARVVLFITIKMIVLKDIIIFVDNQTM